MLSRHSLFAMRSISRTGVAASTTQHLEKPSAIRTPKIPGERTPLAKYGGRHTVVALPGDGIGPEMMEHIRTIFAHSHAPVNFETVQVSSDLVEGDMEGAIMAIKRNGVAIKGNIETKHDNPEFKSRNVELRTRLDLYANILHCVTIPTIPTRHKDIHVLRQRDPAQIQIVTRPCIERIARMALEYAALNNRKKVTAVHKANIQKLGDGLFLEVVREMAKKDYPQIEFESMIVDNACMQLVSKPQQFDVMVMPNLYGNIISNIACGLVGGPGLVSGMNIGEKYAVFETGTRNTGTSLAGKDLANPTAFIRASIDMLRYLNCHHHANMISDALWKALVDQRAHTRDIGGTHKASEVIQITLENIDSMISMIR
ncbi:putative isocitrate dehydrogenase, NAD-dependent [Ancylostoma ceylanicum]|uniref:Putative isocitrate dehydrogenase, NAD-dependent n=1 Tax=Ancylostoma ceylanicum TaxID=53326 RepID=A0A0D6M5L2_9BILA|nr:putative isocitrate dehydrogenase, NAD-dependent [Ancylostoma ceylanicum]